MTLSDCKVEELYSTLYKMDVFDHGHKYAIQCLLTIETIEEELKTIVVEDPIIQFRLDNLLIALKLKKDFFQLALTYKRQELDMWVTLILTFIVMIYGFYNFSGLFN